MIKNSNYTLRGTVFTLTSYLTFSPLSRDCLDDETEEDTKYTGVTSLTAKFLT